MKNAYHCALIIALVGSLLFATLQLHRNAVYAAPLRGDFNADGTVNLIDFNQFLPKLQTTNAAYNLTGSEIVDLYDYNEIVKILAQPPVAKADIYVYNQTPVDPAYSGTITSADGSQTKQLQFLITSNISDEAWKTRIVRVAVSGETTINLMLPEAAQYSRLLSPTSDLPSTFNGRTVNFKLPAGPGVYILKTNNKEETETVVFWVDDFAKVPFTAPPGSTIITPNSNLRSLISSGSSGTTFYFPEGNYQYDTIRIEKKNGLKFVFHPQAMIIQVPSDSTFIEILNSNDISFSGPGQIVAPKGNKRMVMNVTDSTNISLSDFFLYKNQKFSGWTLYIASSDTVSVTNVKIVTGNDGIDPDSSSNVTMKGLYIESRDDGVAIKTTRDKPATNIRFSNGFAKSYASALKIGQCCIKQNVDSIVFENSTVFDSDRALVVDPDRGNGKIGSVLFKNIRIFNVKDYDNAMTLRVRGTSANFDGATNIIFDGINGEMVKTNPIDQGVLVAKVTVQNSQFTAFKNMDLFWPSSCSKLNLINITVNWVAGEGKLGCPQSQ